MLRLLPPARHRRSVSDARRRNTSRRADQDVVGRAAERRRRRRPLPALPAAALVEGSTLADAHFPARRRRRRVVQRLNACGRGDGGPADVLYAQVWDVMNSQSLPRLLSRDQSTASIRGRAGNLTSTVGTMRMHRRRRRRFCGRHAQGWDATMRPMQPGRGRGSARAIAGHARARRRMPLIRSASRWPASRRAASGASALRVGISGG